MTTRTDCCVIGAGISGLVAAKCLREAGLDVVVLERTDAVGGLWKFKESGYGVMRFTHINVSKHNYCFSDFPFPDVAPDFPHHSTMAKYIEDYTLHFGLNEIIRFQTEVRKIEKSGDEWKVETVQLYEGRPTRGSQQTILCRYVAIASGHHSKPNKPKFPGQESFKGEIFHSMDYKDAITNRMVGKRVLVVGIGNSAVDVAVNAASEGRCRAVSISTRSGAWIVPNYVFGCPVDHYACRLFLWLPWKLANMVFEVVLSMVQGKPSKWNLKPKMRALQTQPTVSPTLIHHIQRGHVKVRPNISRIEGSTVHFSDGESIQADAIVLCTGYHIDVPFLSPDIYEMVIDQSSNKIKLYKNVFCPEIGSSLAFIGFVQPASGGILSMSETQARWFAQLCRESIQLPSPQKMADSIKADEDAAQKRYHSSQRHTIQRDPILYNDEISACYGAKPQLWKHPSLAWRLLLGSCGAAQWRLQGPGKWGRAGDEVRRVPLTPMMHYSGLAVVLLILALLLRLFIHFFGCCH